MFTTLELRNFRSFDDLKLQGLRRINLVVGRNNSGKTALLEGIAAVADPQKIGHLPGLLRPKVRQEIYFRWLIRDAVDAAEALVSARNEATSRSVILRRKTRGARIASTGLMPVLQTQRFTVFIPKDQQPINFHAVSVQPRTPEEVVKLFGTAVARRGGEQRMDTLFHEMDERIQKVRVIAGDDGFQVRFDFNLSEMLPLSQLGQGVHRLITIFSELIVEDSSLCIIDEIENGIHHSMLEQIWTGIATAAESLDIQVFATTHSEECIQAADAAFSKRSVYDFAIIQLFRVERGIQGRVLDRKHIEAAIAGEIDLR